MFNNSLFPEFCKNYFLECRLKANLSFQLKNDKNLYKLILENKRFVYGENEARFHVLQKLNKIASCSIIFLNKIDQVFSIDLNSLHSQQLFTLTFLKRVKHKIIMFTLILFNIIFLTFFSHIKNVRFSTSHKNYITARFFKAKFSLSYSFIN